MKADIRIPSQYSDEIERTKKIFSQHFGGYTAYAGEGGWVNDEGELIKDQITVIETVHDDEAALDATLRGLSSRLKYQTDEDAIMYVIDGEKFIYD